VIAAIAAIAAAQPASAQQLSEQARPADSFVDSVGVNIRLHHQGTVYDQGFASIIRPKLLSLGVRHVRDNAYTYASANAQTFFYQRCRALAQDGIRFDLVTSIRTTGSDPTDFTKLDDMWSWCGGGVEAYEGANEPDIATIPAGSPPWTTQTIDAQRALWNGVKGNPAINGLAVFGPSPVFNPQQLGDLSGLLDFGNWHPYPGGQCPTCGDPYGSNIDTLMAKYRSPSGAKQMVFTETGYHNAINSTDTEHRPVSEIAAGKYIPRMLLEHLNRGIARTYLYELIDASPDAAKATRDANFGLLRNDGSEKPAFRGVQGLIGLLRDPGPAFAPGSLSYSLTGATPQVHHTLMQKRDGTFYLALWQERSSFDTGARANAADNRSARGDIANPDVPVTVSVATPTVAATQYRLAVDGTIAASAAAQTPGGLQVPVGDGVTVLEIRPPVRPTDVAVNRRPTLSPVKMRHRTFRPGKYTGKKTRRGHRPKGTAFRYTVSEPATLVVAVDRRSIGRRTGSAAKRRCVAGKPRRASQRCARYKQVGTVRIRVPAGRRSTAFSGWVKGKALPRGEYRARLVAVDALGARSVQRVTSFRIVR
jgi:hypothetical protein